MKQLKTLGLFLLVFSTFNSCSQGTSHEDLPNEFTQEPIVLPTEFVEVSLPKQNTPTWSQLNYLNKEYMINRDGNKLLVRKNLSDFQIEFPLSTSGILKGFDYGEFGGRLIFIPASTNDTILIKKGQAIIDIFTYNDRLFFLESEGYFGGALYQLSIQDESQFDYIKKTDFDVDPLVVKCHEEFIYVVNDSGIMRLDEFVPEYIYKSKWWSGLYPNTIEIVSENDIYLGMRGGILNINPSKKKMKLYVEDEIQKTLKME